MTFDPYKLIKYHLYLLQLENYELVRFWKLLFKRGWFPSGQQRKTLVWTSKVKAIFIICEALILLTAFFLYSKGFYAPFAYFWQRALGFLAKVYILDFFTPIFLSLSTIILWPFDFCVKKALVVKARAKIKSFQNLKIIGIAGSYGKTTMKEVLKEVLGSRFKVQATPESVNTPVGIARWILKELSADDEVLVVEMGEHYVGDVKELCSITRPDVVVITGVNESHLERMKSLDRVISTVFEAVSASKPKSLMVLNGNDNNVVSHYKEFVWPDHRVTEYKVESAKSKAFDEGKLSWKAEFEKIGELEVGLLGEYALGDVDAAIKISLDLNMNPEEIRKGILKIKPVEHRLQPIKSASNILVIDDSYNGNPDGVREAIKVLSQFKNRRKLFITPGLVEMGKASADIHRAIGRQLAAIVDVVILIKNSVTPWIAEGIKNENKIIWFNTTQEAHASLGKILQANDVIVFQNDWGDNYV